MRRLLAGVAGVFSGILPVAACPACWPAYAGVLSSLGISVLGFGTGHFVLAGILLAIAMGMLVYDWKRHHNRPWPLMLGLLGCAFVVASNTYFYQPIVSYAGSASFLSAAIWNGMILRRQRTQKKPTDRDCAFCKVER
ncbi:MAG: MerC domain-containing protein [Candidatus Kerfeldbacteria bacterium]|nr:MerC domain-containing protein [Candidatus Kerfeldbacteria bacterium]